MGRYTDNAPIGNTCPMIDEVIDFLQKIEWDLNDEDEEALNRECKEIIGTMERVREANLTLRTWGNDMYKDRDEFEKERDELEDRVVQLKDEIKHLESLIEQ